MAEFEYSKFRSTAYNLLKITSVYINTLSSETAMISYMQYFHNQNLKKLLQEEQSKFWSSADINLRRVKRNQ